MPKIKSGETISWKEFFKRWGNGIKEVTPIQRLNQQVIFTKIMLIGLICGFITSILNYKTMWWISIILFAALGNTFIQYFALTNQQTLLKNLENKSKEALPFFNKELNKMEDINGIR